MRFVHTSDLHLGRKLAQMSLQTDNQHVLSQLKDLVQRSGAEALVIAGDIFDTANPAEAAVRLWDEFITSMSELGVPVLAISGNHDSGARLAVGSNLIARAGVHIVGELRGELEPVVVGGVNFWLVPFVRPADVRAWAKAQGLDEGSIINYETALRFVCDNIRTLPEFSQRANVCVAHQFVTNCGVSPERSDSEHLSLGTLDNVDCSVFEGFDYVALGHIHGPQKVGRDTIRYAGSPLRLSSSEIRQNKSFTVVGIKHTDGSARVKYKFVPVEPLRNFREERGGVDELVTRGKREEEHERNDFIHAVVTDDDPLDVVARLRRVWPNLEQVTFDNNITRAAGADQLLKDVNLDKDMGTLFREFFLAQTGVPLAEDESKLVDEALQKALVEGGDAE